MLCTLGGELDRAKATAGVTSSTMGFVRWREKSFQGSRSSCTSGGGGAFAGAAVTGVCVVVLAGRGCFPRCGCGSCDRVAVVVGVRWKRRGRQCAAGSGVITSSTACGINLAVGDSSALVPAASCVAKVLASGQQGVLGVLWHGLDWRCLCWRCARRWL